MTTNGQILTDRNIQKLVGRPILLYISLDAATPLTYSRLRNDTFEKIIGNLRRLIAAKGGRGGFPHVHLVFMPMRCNVHELDAFVQLCAELGVDRLVLRPLNYYGHRPRLGAQRLPLRLSEGTAAVRRARARQRPRRETLPRARRGPVGSDGLRRQHAGSLRRRVRPRRRTDAGGRQPIVGFAVGPEPSPVPRRRPSAPRQPAPAASTPHRNLLPSRWSPCIHCPRSVPSIGPPAPSRGRASTSCGAACCRAATAASRSHRWKSIVRPGTAI